MRHLCGIGAAQLQPAQLRRSDQDSRGMIRGRTVKAIGDDVIENRERTARRQRLRDSGCRRRLDLCNARRAPRAERAILAIIAFLCVRTAGHLGCHRRIAHLECRQQFRSRRHDCRRSQKPGDGERREQAAYRSETMHAAASHRSGNFESNIVSQVRQQDSIDASQSHMCALAVFSCPLSNPRSAR